MNGGAYRLWQAWQQMHYPDLPSADETDGVDLVALDGRAGACLEVFFERAKRVPSDVELRDGMERCADELDRVEGVLAGDAARYFGRLRLLLGLVLAESTDQRRGGTRD